MRVEPKTDAAGETGVPPAGQTLLDELREVYDAIDDDDVQTEVFDVEGSRAAVRYRRLSFKQSQAALASDGELWEQNAQFLIEACDEILIRNPAKKPGPKGDGDLEPLVEGQRVTFDLRPGESIPLHQALGVQETDVRRSVLRLFQGADQVLLRHGAAVDLWMGTLRQRTRERFSGE